MKIVVRPLRKAKSSAWQVCLDEQIITFPSEVEARDYVATLEARIAAPHTLPAREVLVDPVPVS